MSRRHPVNLLINMYKRKKTELDELKKETDGLNKEIKEYLVENNLEEASSDKWTAKMKRTVREKIDDDKLLAKLKELLNDEQLAKVVKTKEFVDEDALENLIYDGALSAADLESCKTPGKEVLTLRIVRKKGE